MMNSSYDETTSLVLKVSKEKVLTSVILVASYLSTFLSKECAMETTQERSAKGTAVIPVVSFLSMSLN